MPAVSAGPLVDRCRARARTRARPAVISWLVIVATAALLLSGCGATQAGPSSTQGVAVHTSLATSLESAAGAWAVVPMGHLDQPLNTFWQLFFKPAGAKLWSNRASALAVATNGGLAIASNGASLAVGIRPTNLLDYSPLVLTSDARSWLPGGPIGMLPTKPV